MNPINNSLYFRRRSRVCLPEAQGDSKLSKAYIATLLKNLEPLGFIFSEALIQACRKLTVEQLGAFYKSLYEDLLRAKGAHRKHKPLYPNFPQQVMEASTCELYFNAILHYLSAGKYRPETKKEKRPILQYATPPQVIELGDEAEFQGLFGQIIASNTSLSEQDKEDALWFFEAYGADITPLLPETIRQKESVAFVAAALLKHTPQPVEMISRYVDTATDVLRLAVALSKGDISLATPTRFRSFSRAERNLLLSLLERKNSLLEDMIRWKYRWIRLGERLHPGEYTTKYPQTAQAFTLLRSGASVPTFHASVEKALVQTEMQVAIAKLRSRPGEFARRLDHLLRLSTETQAEVLTVFAEIAKEVSTPVLLQVIAHFREREAGVDQDMRVFFPKGNVAKGYGKTETLPALDAEVCAVVGLLCKVALINRFSTLPPLGKVYVDPALENYLIPFSQRSASKSFRTLVRGSRVPLPKDCTVLRFFVWWKNGKERTDIDLSATTFDKDFCMKDVISYYNLRGYGGCHSGDIVDAPKGASEFIDITLKKGLEIGARFVVMTLTSYTEQPYCDLPECFAGWMARKKPKSGEIFEPRTVQDRLDITANTKIAYPLVIDLERHEVIWCDMALKDHPMYCNNVAANLKGISLTLKAFTQLRKPNLYDLFLLHAVARGERVQSPEEAETLFTVESGIPFHLEEIASEYL
jgi:hypothetical protein